MATEEKKIEQTPEMKAEEKRQRQFVKEVLYPHLLKVSISIADGHDLCQASDAILQQLFSKKMGEMQKDMSSNKMSWLDMQKEEALKDEQYSKMKELFALFEDETVFTTSSLLGGMAKAIESFQREESTKRTLDTLKTEFLD